MKTAITPAQERAGSDKEILDSAERISITAQARKLLTIWPDLFVIIALMAMISVASFQISRYIPDVLSHEGDVWFDSDTRRVINDMTDRSVDHWRANVHPLFPLITFLPTKTLIKAFGLEPIKAVRFVVAAIAALWISALFIILRLIGCCLLDALLFAMIGATSARNILECRPKRTLWARSAFACSWNRCIVRASQDFYYMVRGNERGDIKCNDNQLDGWHHRNFRKISLAEGIANHDQRIVRRGPVMVCAESLFFQCGIFYKYLRGRIQIHS
jgi:hypothetical protein